MPLNWDQRPAGGVRPQRFLKPLRSRYGVAEGERLAVTLREILD